jgi:hypothetical protein
VRLATDDDTALKEEPADLHALAPAGLYDEIVANVREEGSAYTATGQLTTLAMEWLMREKQYAPR